MLAFLLGLICLVAIMAMLGMFSSAQVRTLKSLGIWIAGIGGVALAMLMLFTGRGASALWTLIMLGPLLWSWIGPRVTPPGQGGPRAGQGPSPRASRGAMSRAEAYEVLGLKPGATEAEIRAAHRRLMQAAHPDRGGSDWLAARINQARDVLLG